jgi:hypothetical protein
MRVSGWGGLGGVWGGWGGRPWSGLQICFCGLGEEVGRGRVGQGRQGRQGGQGGGRGGTNLGVVHQ